MATLDELMERARGIQSGITAASSGVQELQQRKDAGETITPETQLHTPVNLPTPEPLQEIKDTDDITGNQGETFTPPTPLGQSALEDFTASITATLDKQRVALEAAHQAELDRIQTNKDAAEVKRQELLDTQKDILETDVKPLTDPFREETENAERDRLKVEENFFANQALTDELEGLLTDIQLSVQREKDVTGLAAIREPRIASVAEDMTARVGVIQASMAARNNQIAVAENLIDRTVVAMTADRQDQLNYYNSLLSFYDGQKDFEENKIIQLTSDEKGMIETQIGLIEQDMQITLSNVENIKQAMLDPDTAQAYAQAGVTLNDSPEVIAQKLGAYGYTQEVSNTSNQMQTNGYNYLSPGQNAPAGSDVITTTDSKGRTKSWYKEAEVDTSAPSTIGGGTMMWDSAQGKFVPTGFVDNDSDEIGEVFFNDEQITATASAMIDVLGVSDAINTLRTTKKLKSSKTGKTIKLTDIQVTNLIGEINRLGRTGQTKAEESSSVWQNVLNRLNQEIDFSNMFTNK